ncbi:universal stress protein [Pseudoxanthomonas sp. UC19_8]|uniref:universal stress protein n=1 Tax=Pseudoxanthomonas sp. UC19_8 TaxID=3350175 RepID=UPI0036D2C73B
MLKNILVPLTDTAGDNDALSVAIKLAQSYEAQVRAAEICDLPLPTEGPWDLIPTQALTAAETAVRSLARNRAELVRGRVAGYANHVSVEVWEANTDYPSAVAALLAQAADLCVLPGWAGLAKPAPQLKRFFNAVLFQSGTPILLVPPRCKHPLPPERALVAWNGSPNARRALSGALPLLRRAEQVHVVEIDPPLEGLRADEALRQALGDHLERHGIETAFATLRSKASSCSEVLLSHARKVDAQLLVMGGYGHSRLREWSLGGMTRDVLAASALPVLVAH